MNLCQWFDLTFGPRAGQEALEWAGQVYTFGDIDARSNRMAQGLEARGIVKGDRLCVYLANANRVHRSVSRLRQAGRDLRPDQYSVSRARDVAHPERRRTEASHHGEGASGAVRGSRRAIGRAPS